MLLISIGMRESVLLLWCEIHTLLTYSFSHRPNHSRNVRASPHKANQITAKISTTTATEQQKRWQSGGSDKKTTTTMKHNSNLPPNAPKNTEYRNAKADRNGGRKQSLSPPPAMQETLSNAPTSQANIRSEIGSADKSEKEKESISSSSRTQLTISISSKWPASLQANVIIWAGNNIGGDGNYRQSNQYIYWRIFCSDSASQIDTHCWGDFQAGDTLLYWIKWDESRRRRRFWWFYHHHHQARKMARNCRRLLIAFLEGRKEKRRKWANKSHLLGKCETQNHICLLCIIKRKKINKHRHTIQHLFSNE